jgi:hypothetical protein
MSVHKYSAGLSNVGSYQVSGRPWITGSSNLDANKVHMIEFPRVTKSITIINNNASNGEDIRVHFQSGSTAIVEPGDNGGGTAIADATSDVILHNHFITVPAGFGSLTMDVKCSKVFVSNGTATANLKYQVFAELTQIPTGSMFNLTGSGICGDHRARYQES